LLISFVMVFVDDISRTYNRIQGTCRRWCCLRRHHGAVHRGISSRHVHTLDKPLVWVPRCPCRPRRELEYRKAYREAWMGTRPGRLLLFERLAICLLKSVSYGSQQSHDKVFYWYFLSRIRCMKWCVALEDIDRGDRHSLRRREEYRRAPLCLCVLELQNVDTKKEDHIWFATVTILISPMIYRRGQSLFTCLRSTSHASDFIVLEHVIAWYWTCMKKLCQHVRKPIRLSSCATLPIRGE
jgi:hypothetical protein